ncbi:histamine N-methyltransferase-like [Ptychodera flava]|uniref:histamine N-methyltransferase-like n=1 Tax=Ptychodera flava TaxID=63121 RepID=UPI00396A8BC0
MTQDLKALVRFPEKYFEAHVAIRRLRPDDFFDQRKTHVRDTFENFVFSGEKDSMLRVLAVGSSNGTSDIPIIDTLDSKYSSIYYIAVEPLESQIQQFEHLVKSKQEAGLWKNTKFAFHPTTIEEYLKKREPGGFDIIHLQHSAYHLADPESVIVELYGQLNKGGMLFTTLVVGAWEKIYLYMGTIVPDPILP